MRCIAWNYRGLGNPRAIRALCELVRKEVPHVMFLSETKLHESKLDTIRRKCSMTGCFGVNVEGMSGGLVIMWKDEINLKILNFSRNHIDMRVDMEEEIQSWRLTRIYGEPEVNRRKDTWRLLRELAEQQDLPWCCFGDFNEILWDQEKSRQSLKKERQMIEFKEVLEDCMLEDLGFVGHWYTWEKGRHVENNITERLDKVVA